MMGNDGSGCDCFKNSVGSVGIQVKHCMYSETSFKRLLVNWENSFQEQNCLADH